MKKYLNLENFLYLTVFFLPLYLFRIKLSFFSTNILEILIIGSIFWWLLFFQPKTKWVFFYNNYKRYIISGGLILLGLFVSAFLNGNVLQSLGIIKGWFLLPIAFMLIIANVIPKERAENIFIAYAYSSFSVATIALAYLILGKVTYDNRLAAFYNSPNYLAMQLAPGIIILFWRYFFSGKQKKEIAMAVITLVALLFTASYAAFVAVFLGTVMILWQKKEFFTKKKNLKAIILLLFIFISLLSFQLDKPKFKSLMSLDNRSSLASRRMIWKSARKIGSDNAIFGIGAANFQEKYLAYQKFFPPYLEWAVPHPQNIYFNFWLSGGILGLGGFLSLVFFLLKDLWINKNQDKLRILVLGILTYILIHGLFDSTYFKNDLAVLFWLCFIVLKNQPQSMTSKE